MKKYLFSSTAIAVLIFSLNIFSASLCHSQNTSVVTFNNVHQRFGATNTRTVEDTFVLPSSLAGFKQILMHIDLSCPPGGCDQWDRFANISLKKDNEWIEIGRYITPYRKACGWIADVTDYSTLLTDTVILNSFIDTWVDPAWLVKVTFEYVAGTPAIPLTKVKNIWQNYGLVYGDPTQVDTFAVANPVIENGTDSVKLKVVLTGHGQGNTDNAAEFSQKTHQVYVDGVSAFSHLLWRSNCNTNPCSPQSGTWQYNRAGWCPGADVVPVFFDLTSYVTAGSSVELDYRLQTYFNNCSPSNTACISGSTCSDCNYNYNGHTQPYYAMSGQLITYISAATSVKELDSRNAFSVFPNPVMQGNILSVQLTTKTSMKTSRLEIYNVIGEKVYSHEIENLTSFTLRQHFNPGIYFVKLSAGEEQYVQKLIVQ